MSDSGFPISAPVAVVHTNLQQEVIQITDDKLRLALDDHLRRREDAKSWMGPFGILFAVTTSFCTAEFKAVWNIPAAAWQAMFIVLGIASFVWLVNSVIRIFRGPSIDDLMKKIKNLR